MYCHKCGEQIKEGSIFCHKCGAKVANEDIQLQDLKATTVRPQTGKGECWETGTRITCCICSGSYANRREC